MKEQKVEYGKAATEPATAPTKVGYNFLGWFDGDKEYDFTAVVKADLTLKAKWEKGDVYTVVYEPTEGVTYPNGAKTTYRVKTGDTHVLKDATDVTVGGNKGLKGWIVRPAGSTSEADGTEYKAGEEIEITENVIVTPVLDTKITVKLFESVKESASFNGPTNGVFTWKANEGNDFATALTQPIAEGGVVVVDDPAKVGYTFTGWATLEPTWADKDETKVEADANGKPVYELVPFDLATPIEDLDSDGVFSLYATWEAVDLDVVAYVNSKDKDYLTSSATYDFLVKGAAIEGDAKLVAGEVANVTVIYDALVKNVTSGNTPTNVAPAVFVPAPEGIVAGDKFNYSATTAANVKTVLAATTLTNQNTGLASMTIDDKAVPGVFLPVNAANPYYVFEFEATGGAKTARYVINLTSYAADEVADVAVNLGLGTAKLYKGEVKDANEVKSLFNVATLTMPIGATIETPEAGSLVKGKAGDDTVIPSAFVGLDVLDRLNKEVEADEDGNYTVEGNMSVSFNWGSAVTISFDPDKTKYTNNTYTGVGVDPIVWPAKTTYELPECEFTPPTGQGFSGWTVEIGSDSLTGIKPVGFVINVTDDVTLTANWAKGSTVTLYSGFGDDTNTQTDETQVKVYNYLDSDTNKTFNVPAKIDDEWGWKIPDGLRFAGWVSKEYNGATPDTLGAADTILPASTKTLTVDTSTPQNRILYAIWIPEVKFTSADPAYVATLSTNSQMLDKTAYEKNFANLPVLTFTPDEDAENTFIVTSEAAIPYGKSTAKYDGTGTAGNYFAIDIDIPEDYVLTDAVKLTTSTGSNTALQLNNYYDGVGEYDEATKNITWVTQVSKADGNGLITATFNWGRNIPAEVYTFDISALKCAWPVTFNFNGARDASGTVLKDVVVQVANGSELAVADEALAQAAKAVGKVLNERVAWKYTQGGTTADFDPLKHVKVTAPTTMTAQWDTAQVTLNVNLDGGTLGASTSLDGITDKVTTKKVTYGSDLILPGNDITKPGAFLKSWKVDGIEVSKTYQITNITKDTKIEAVWTSYLGTLDVAPLADATDPTLTVVDEASYKVGYYKTENKVKTFVDQTGTGTGVAEANNIVKLTIKADGLVAHSNTADVYGTAMNNAYVVGLKITPPEGLGITQYALTVSGTGTESADKTSGDSTYKNIPDDGYVTAYLNVSDGDKTDNTNTVKVTWYDGTNAVGSLVTYQIKTETTRIVKDGYTINFTVSDAAAKTDAGATEVTRTVRAGKKMADLTVSAADGYYWDADEVAKVALPSGFTAEVKELSDGKTTQLVVKGTVPATGLAKDTVTIDFKGALTAKDPAATIYASEFEFVADGKDSGSLTNNSDYDVFAYDDQLEPISIPAGETVALDGLTVYSNFGVTVYVEGSYTMKAGGTTGKATVSVGQQTIAPLTAHDPIIVGGNGYVSGFATGVTYQYRQKGTTTWNDVAPNAKGNLELAAGTYEFQVPASGNKLASAPVEVVITAATAATSAKTVSIYASETATDAVTYQTTATGGINKIPTGTYTIKGTGISVTITSSTVFAEDADLVAA